MKSKISLFKKTGLVIISSFLLLITTNAVAQKSIYHVIPGSGPKKTTKQDLPTIDKGHNKATNEIGPYTTRRKHLPPGQAKKIYGGSAKDYAPGQMNKRYKKDGKHRHFKKYKYNKHDNEERKGNNNHED